MAEDIKKKHVYIIGSKGIPAHYGGFETFVDNLVSRQVSEKIKYHVACMSDKKKRHGKYAKAELFYVKTRNIHSARAVLYDILSMKHTLKQIQENNLSDGVVYILACRIGPVFNFFVRKLHKRGFKVYVNPDGHEWMRAKWSAPVKLYWRISERMMIKHADLVICDSTGIQHYVEQEYSHYHPKTTYLAYGADTSRSGLKDGDEKLQEFYKKWGIKKRKYYLMVGRFVPENNFETVIKEFIECLSEDDLVIITNHENNKYFEKLKKTTLFEHDDRIKFVGTIYDTDLLKKIRENSFAYIHGHSVGGTNPSLLEALASTNINILYDCIFNREVAGRGALYFTLEEGSLRRIFNRLTGKTAKDYIRERGIARSRINEMYDWGGVVEGYEEVFCE